MSEERVLFFAIGSMANPTSMALRNCRVTRSFPAVLSAHRRVFVSSGSEAWADLRPSADGSDCVFSVVHEMSVEAKRQLDAREGDNHVRTVVVTLLPRHGAAAGGTADSSCEGVRRIPETRARTERHGPGLHAQQSLHQPHLPLCVA